MFNLFQMIMPKEDRFFEMFDRHAACVLAGAETLREMGYTDGVSLDSGVRGWVEAGGDIQD